MKRIADLEEQVKSLEASVQNTSQNPSASGIDINQIQHLVTQESSGILLEDQNRKIIFVNTKFTDLFKVDVNAQDLIGTDCSDIASSVKSLFVEEEHFVIRVNEIFNSKVITLNEQLELRDGRCFE
ncbi:MAG: hypothetical protein ACKO8Q_00185, partial [Bacteroidota bacterium]